MALHPEAQFERGAGHGDAEVGQYLRMQLADVADDFIADNDLAGTPLEVVGEVGGTKAVFTAEVVEQHIEYRVYLGEPGIVVGPERAHTILRAAAVQLGIVTQRADAAYPR